MGPVATEKKKMKESGKLDKYGRPNENTPASWNKEYQDYNLTVNGEQVVGQTEQAAIEGAPVKEGIPGQGQETTSQDEVMAAPAVDPSTGDAETPVKSKKRKHEGESAEEKAERKKKKAEKKEKRKSKSKKDDSDSE